MKKIKPEDVAYELRELSKNTSLSPEIINIISHGYERICQLERERDEARFAAAYQYAKHHNGDVQTLMDNFCELKGWQKIQFFVGDDDHAKMEANYNNTKKRALSD